MYCDERENRKNNNSKKITSLFLFFEIVFGFVFFPFEWKHERKLFGVGS